TALLVSGHFVGADVEASIDGGGIAVENFAAEPLGQRQTQRALPGRSRSEHGKHERLRAQSTRMNTYTMSAASTMMSPSCCVRVGMLEVSVARILPNPFCLPFRHSTTARDRVDYQSPVCVARHDASMGWTSH